MASSPGCESPRARQDPQHVARLAFVLDAGAAGRGGMFRKRAQGTVFQTVVEGEARTGAFRAPRQPSDPRSRRTAPCRHPGSRPPRSRRHTRREHPAPVRRHECQRGSRCSRPSPPRRARRPQVACTGTNSTRRQASGLVPALTADRPCRFHDPPPTPSLTRRQGGVINILACTEASHTLEMTSRIRHRLKRLNLSGSLAFSGGLNHRRTLIRPAGERETRRT